MPARNDDDLRRLRAQLRGKNAEDEAKAAPPAKSDAERPRRATIPPPRRPATPTATPIPTAPPRTAIESVATEQMPAEDVASVQIASSSERGDGSESTITLGVDDVELLAATPPRRTPPVAPGVPPVAPAVPPVAPAVPPVAPAVPPVAPPVSNAAALKAPAAAPPVAPGLRGTLPFGSPVNMASEADDTVTDARRPPRPTPASIPPPLAPPSEERPPRLTPAPVSTQRVVKAQPAKTPPQELLAVPTAGFMLPVALDRDWTPPEGIPAEPAFAEEPPAPLFDGADARLMPALDCVSFFTREAGALGLAQPERAAAMWLEAGRTALREGADQTTIERLLAKAASQAPASAALAAQLRRLHFRRREWQPMLAASQRQVELGGSVATRVAVLIEAAAVQRLVLTDPRAALELLDRCLDLLPTDTTALSMAAALHLELSEEQAAVERLEQLTETLSAPEERARCLYTIGALLESRLRLPQRAIEAYGRAIEADPRHTPALVALCELHEQLGEWAQLARRLEQLAALEPADAARQLARAGALHLDRIGDLDAAARVLAAAEERAPDDAAPLSRLAQTLEARGSYRELESALRRLDQLTFDPASRAALRTRIGGLAETQLRDPARAIEAYRSALRAVPGYLPALQALGTLHRREGRLEDLLALLAPETEDESPTGLRAERCLEAALLLEELERPAEAITYLQRALEVSPGHAVVFWRLRGLLTRLDQHADLATLLAAQIEQTADIKTRHHLLLELARLQATHLARPDAATASYTLARKVEVNRSPAIELADLFEREGRWRELVELLIEEARDTRDPAEAQGHRLRAATVLERELDEPERALALLERVLAANPDESGALRAAGRMHHRLGRWSDLVALYQHELGRCADDGVAAELLCRIGRVQDELLGQPAAAIETYLQALERRPQDSVALAALERLVRSEQRFADLIDVLRRHARACTDAGQAADALCRAAELADSRLDDGKRALALFDEALARVEAHFDALYGKLALQLRLGLREDARQTLVTLVATTNEERPKALLELRLARHEELRLRRPPSDADLREHLRSSPFAEQLRAEVLRLDRLAGRLDLGASLVELAERTQDPTLAAGLFLEGAQRAELIDDDDEQLLLCASSAFAAREESTPVIWALQRALERTQQLAELAALYEHEAAAEGEFTVRIPILADAAVAYLGAGDPTEAARVARQCLSGDRHHLPSLLLLGRLAEERQSFTEFAATCDQIAEACREPQNRLRAALIASDSWASNVGDRARALAALQPALTDDPGQVDAFARAERLLAQTRDYTQLSRLYSRRINVCPDLRQKVELLRLNARLLRDRLGDSTRAIGELAQLLALAPRDIDALVEQAALLCRHHRWSDAVATLGTLIEAAEDAPVRRDARLRQARLWLQQLHEPRRARTVLEQALGEDEGDDGARRLLVEAHAAEGEWGAARTLLQLLASRSGEATLGLRVWALARLADVARTGLRDDALREQCELSALALAGGERALLDGLVAGFVARGEIDRLRTLAMTLVSRAGGTETLAPLRTALGRLLLDTGDARQALDQLREVLIADPDHEEARLLTARAREALGESEVAATSYRALLAQNVSCHEAARGLARVVGPLGQPAVVSAAGALLELAGVANADDIERVEALDRSGTPGGTLPWHELRLAPEDEDEETRSRPLAALEDALLPLIPHLDGAFKMPLSAVVGTSHPAASAAMRIANALGLPSVQVSIEGSVPPVQAGLGRPVPLRIAPELAALPDEAPFRFWVGRALGAAANAGVLLEQLDDARLVELFEALSDPKPFDAHVAQLRKQLLRALPRKLRKQLEQDELRAPPPELWPLYRTLEQRRADRVGLLVSSNPRIAFAELDGVDVPRLASLMRFALSEDFDRLYRQLWSSRA